MSKQTIKAMSYGVGTIFMLILSASLILSLLLKFTSMQESSLTWFIAAFSFLSLFIGGFISGGKGKEKGWLTGGLTGLIFTLLVFLVQFLGYQSTFNIEQSLYHSAYILIAVVGGIFGVNVSSKRAT
jgi:putative membrane protein (TIGR04086 family)